LPTNYNIMEFHHFGLAVYNFEPALGFYQRLGYHISDRVTDPLQNVELIMCTSCQQPAVELIKPLNEDAPIHAFLKKNQEMIYHSCYRVDSIDLALKNYFNGMRVIKVSKPKPAILFNHSPVGFYFVKGIGLVELLEKPLTENE